MVASLLRKHLPVLLSDGSFGNRHSLLFEVAIAGSRILESSNASVLYLLCCSLFCSNSSPANAGSGNVKKKWRCTNSEYGNRPACKYSDQHISERTRSCIDGGCACNHT